MKNTKKLDLKNWIASKPDCEYNCCLIYVGHRSVRVVSLYEGCPVETLSIAEAHDRYIAAPRAEAEKTKKYFAEMEKYYTK